MTPTLANLITLFRIGIIAVIIPAFLNFYYGLVLILFCLASLSDFFDGYVARQLNQTTRSGRILDPVADKMIVWTLFILLIFIQKFSWLEVIFVIILLCRDALVSGLREYAEVFSNHKTTVHVTSFAKLKTAFQMLSILLYLVDLLPISHSIDTLDFMTLSKIAALTLMLSVLFSLLSLGQYLKIIWRHSKSGHTQ